MSRWNNLVSTSCPWWKKQEAMSVFTGKWHHNTVSFKTVGEEMRPAWLPAVVTQVCWVGVPPGRGLPWALSMSFSSEHVSALGTDAYLTPTHWLGEKSPQQLLNEWIIFHFNNSMSKKDCTLTFKNLSYRTVKDDSKRVKKAFDSK